MTLIDKAEAHDDDLIRRGDALRVADEVFDQCENVHGDDKGAFAAAEVGARIAALPAVTVWVFECAGCGRLCRDPEADLAALRAKGAISCCPERRMEPLSPAPAAQAREAALREAHKAILAMDTKKDEDLTYNLAVLRAAEKVRRLISEART